MRANDSKTYGFHEMFPREATAAKWWESVRWPRGRHCPHCGSAETAACGRPQPYRCRSCRRHFSAKVGTVAQNSRLSIKKWLHAMYLMSAHGKGMSSVQFGRQLGIAQEAAWRLGHKLREAWNRDALFPMREGTGWRNDHDALAVRLAFTSNTSGQSPDRRFMRREPMKGNGQ